MQVDPGVFEYLRAVARNDHDASERIEAKLDGSDGWGGFEESLAMVFLLALRRRFTAAPNRGQVMQFIAEMRSGSVVEPYDIDVAAAASLIRTAFDPSVPHQVQAEMAGRIQGLTIIYLLGPDRATEQELDDLLAEAAELVGGG
ncbi:hypothetical protein AB0J86_37290 [Micromonospora sp. NPDC049559]|uniref:hypothetical protein n=1 Tax=Micromonospora sp. NPDC049559 TaxID=3155923 RepID=UPI00342275F7